MRKLVCIPALLTVVFALSSCEGVMNLFFPEKNQAPAMPVLTSPANGATGVSLTPSLTWQPASDPDSDTVSYDVYYGTADPPSKQASSTNNSFSIPTALTPSTMYYWKVLAKDGKGGETFSTQWSFTTGAGANHAPGAPLLTAPATNATGIALSPTFTWQPSTDPDGDTVTYDIYYATNSAPTSQGSSSGASYTVTTALTASTTYYWKVLAKDGRGGETFSALWSFTTGTGVNQPPSAPVLTSPANNATGVALSLTFTWQASTDPDADAVTYDVYYGTTSTPTLQGTSPTASYTVTAALSASTTYYWKVSAKDGRGGETFSTMWSFTTGAGANQPPTAPVLTAPTNNTTGLSLTPTLTWQASTDPNSDPVKYDVYYGTDNPPATRQAPQLTGTAHVISTPLQVSTTYYWKVAADDGQGGTASSAVWSFTTIAAANQPPTAPVLTAPGDNTTGVSATPTFTWQASTDPENDTVTYDIYYGTTTTPGYQGSAAGTSYVAASALSTPTIYYWRVTAKDSHGNQASSALWSFTTAAANSAPTQPTLATPANGATAVTLSPMLMWNPSTDPDGDTVAYDVYYGTDNPPATKQASLVTMTSYTLTAQLNPQATYYWQIVANDGRGGLRPSAVWSFTTQASTISISGTITMDAGTIAQVTGSPQIWLYLFSTLPPTTPAYTIHFAYSSPAAYSFSNVAPGQYYIGAFVDLNGDQYYETSEPSGGYPLSGGPGLLQYSTSTSNVNFIMARGNTAPSQPVLVQPSNGSPDMPLQPMLMWNASTDAENDTVRYNVYYGTDNPPATKQVSLTTMTSHTISPALTAGTTYYWKVEADDGHGGLTSSAVWSFGTATVHGITNWDFQESYSDWPGSYHDNTSGTGIYDVVDGWTFSVGRNGQIPSSEINIGNEAGNNYLILKQTTTSPIDGNAISASQSVNYPIKTSSQLKVRFKIVQNEMGHTMYYDCSPLDIRIRVNAVWYMAILKSQKPGPGETRPVAATLGQWAAATINLNAFVTLPYVGGTQTTLHTGDIIDGVWIYSHNDYYEVWVDYIDLTDNGS